MQMIEIGFLGRAISCVPFLISISLPSFLQQKYHTQESEWLKKIQKRKSLIERINPI